MQRNPTILAVIVALFVLCLVGTLCSFAGGYFEWFLGVASLLVVSLVSTTRIARARRGAVRRRIPAHFQAGVKSDVDADEAESLSGTWSGTARIWPLQRKACLRIYPLRVAISDGATRAHLLPGERGDAHDGVVAVEMLEYDAVTGNLDFRVVVEESGREEEFVAPVGRGAGMLISEDESARFTLELKRDQVRQSRGQAGLLRDVEHTSL